MSADGITADLANALPGGETPDVVTPEVTPPADAVSKAEFDALQTKLADVTNKLGGLSETAALVEKAKQIFFKQDTGTPLSKDDMAVRTELLRIMPELKNVPNISEALQQIKTSAAAAQSGIHASAWNFQQSLQRDYKIGVDDPEMAEMIGVNIKEWINKDPARVQRYFAGDTKEIVKEGFEHVVGKLLGPARLAKKRDVVARVANAPIVPARGGVAGVDGGKSASLDFSDKKSVRAALRSSFVSDDV